MRQIKIERLITKRATLSLDKYLGEITRMSDLITAEREVELAKEIAKGNDDALNELVEANLRFVVSVAKKYQSDGNSLNDLISEGNIGLMVAAKRFDYTKGFKFISY